VRSHSTGVLTGVPSGISRLDDLLGGFQKANLIAIAGSSGVGKSGLALQLGVNAALGTSVLLCSLQVSGPEHVARHAETLEISAFQDAIKDEVSRRAVEPLDGEQQRSTTQGTSESITDLELRAIRMGGERANGLKLAILDVPRLRIGSLRVYCTRMAKSESDGLHWPRRDWWEFQPTSQQMSVWSVALRGHAVGFDRGSVL